MRKVILFTAVSLDSYIAKTQGFPYLLNPLKQFD